MIEENKIFSLRYTVTHGLVNIKIELKFERKLRSDNQLMLCCARLLIKANFHDRALTELI